MFKETIDCIDAGTEYCPCHLAESGECILCSQLQGSHFCDCLNWNGVCIYQELYNNGNKAKEQRKAYTCKVSEKVLCQDDVLLIKDLKLKGSSEVLKKGTKFKNIRLVNGDHNVDCGKIMLKSEFLKKA